MNLNNRSTSKLITLTAFLIGYVLIDDLNSNEQNALGNFFMLIGQTLCTSGSENFKRDWKNVNNPVSADQGSGGGVYYARGEENTSGEPLSREQTIRILNRARDVFNQEIDKIG